MSQLGPLLLAGLGQGQDLVAQAHRLALADDENRRRNAEMELARQQMEQQAEAARIKTVEEKAARQFWGQQLTSLMPPQQPEQAQAKPGTSPYDVPDGPFASPAASPVGAQQFMVPPDMRAADLEHAVRYTNDLQQQQAKAAQQAADADRFRKIVGSFAYAMRKKGLYDEAEQGEQQSLATGKWAFPAIKPPGLVEPGVIQNLGSTDPAVRAGAVSEYMKGTGGKTPPAYLMPPRDPQGRAPTTPAEAQARFEQLVKVYGGEANIDPVMLGIFRDRTMRGERISTEEFRAAANDDRYADRGEEEALKIDADDAGRRLQAVEKAYGEALKFAQGDESKIDPNIINQRNVARLDYATARKALKEALRARGQAIKAAPAAAPAPQSAAEPTDDEISQAIQIMRQELGREPTDEEVEQALRGSP